MFGFLFGVIVCAVVIAVALNLDVLVPIAKQLVADAKDAIAKLRAGQ